MNMKLLNSEISGKCFQVSSSVWDGFAAPLVCLPGAHPKAKLKGNLLSFGTYNLIGVYIHNTWRNMNIPFPYQHALTSSKDKIDFKPL